MTVRELVTAGIIFLPILGVTHAGESVQVAIIAYLAIIAFQVTLIKDEVADD